MADAQHRASAVRDGAGAEADGSGPTQSEASSPAPLLKRSVTDTVAEAASASSRIATTAADVAGVVAAAGGERPGVVTPRPAHTLGGGSLSPPLTTAPERQLFQMLHRAKGSTSSASPTPSPRSAPRPLLDPESQVRSGHGPASAGSAAGAAVPIYLEGRSYRFQHAHPVDGAAGARPQLATSPEEPDSVAQFSTSYTATSNTIRDSTARLASMALYDEGEQEGETEAPSQAGNAHRQSGSTASDLGSGFRFDAHKKPADQSDLLSTSPRAPPRPGPSNLTLALQGGEGGHQHGGVMQPPAVFKSPPPIEYDETPRLNMAASRSTLNPRSESNATSTDAGSDFSVEGPSGAATSGNGAQRDHNDAAKRRGDSVPTPSAPSRHIAFAADQDQTSAGAARAMYMPRRTSLGGSTPQDMIASARTSASAFQPSSFSGFGGGFGGGGFRSSFGFGALAQAQAEAEAEQGHQLSSSGGGANASGFQLPGGFTQASVRSPGYGGRRSSVARPTPPGASSLSLHRTPSHGRRSFAHGGSSLPVDSHYGSIDSRDDEHERGRYGRRESEGTENDEQQALLGPDRPWRSVLGGPDSRQHIPQPRTVAGKVIGAITLPVRAIGTLFSRNRSRSRSPARSSAHGAAANHISTRERIYKTMSKENLKSMIMEPIVVLPAVVLGLLLNLLDGVSYGMIIFPNSNPIFANFGGDGVAMFFVTCVISQLVYSLGGSVFKAGNGSMMIEVVPFFHILVRKIVEEFGDENPAAVIATTCMAFALSSVLTGIVFLLLGMLRLGVLIGFFPRHILVGCIGGVGIFLLETGFEVAGRLESEGGFQYNLETLRYFFQSPHVVSLWLIPLSLAILLRVITAKFNHPLVVPAYFVLMPAVFYAVAFPVGMSLYQLRKDGWVFDIGNGADAPFWRFYTYFDLAQTSYMALLATMPTQLALVFLSILHPPLNIPALAVSVGQDDVNTDRELTAHGWSNIIAGSHVLLPALGFLIAGKRLQA